MTILGLNYSLDSAAALLENGRVLAAAAEERFNRVKHTGAFPSGALDYCLRSQGMESIHDVDAVAFFWNPGTHLEHFDSHRSTQWRHHSEFLTAVPNYLLNKIPGDRHAGTVDYTHQRFEFKDGNENPLDIYYFDHHLCHAASCFYLSPWEEAAILTVDGFGERTSALMAKGEGTTITPLKRIEFPHSLGSFYGALTQYLGFRPNRDEGKVMALAAFGETTFVQPMRELFSLKDGGSFELDLSCFSFFQQSRRRYSEKFEEIFGSEREPGEEISQRHRDVARAGQAALETVLVHLAGWLKSETGLKRLCMAGGVALNSVANSSIQDEAGFAETFIVPAAGDDGSSLGAALYLVHGLQGKPREMVLDHAFWGPEFSDADIEGVLKASKLEATAPDDLAEAVAGLLAEGKFVGWFQGRMEFGPRALGARSILADPRGKDIKDVLNDQVKHRESFRPFAPAVLEDRCGEYFEPDSPSPFMLKVQQTRSEMQSDIPAVIHADGTARAQTVGADSGAPKFRRLIESFDRLTGIPMILNTSFNVQGEPIVCTPQDALRCFYTTGLDALALGKFLLVK